MSTQAFSTNLVSRKRIHTIALGSDRAAKIMAVRASIARVAEIDSAWRNASVVARPVETDAPAMPLTDWELMGGARKRAMAVREILIGQKLDADLYVGLKGGLEIGVEFLSDENFAHG